MKIINIILIFFFSMQFANASYITLQSSISYSEEKVSVQIINKGDEPAYNIQPSISIKDISLQGKAVNKLDVNEPSLFEFFPDYSGLLPGNYPLILQIDYTDANSYPFSAISTANIAYVKSSSSGLVMAMEPIELSGSNKLKVSIKNLDNVDKDIILNLVVPKELTIEEEKSIRLEARDETTVSFKIKDFSARPASTYAVFAVAEFDSSSMHHTAITSATVKIVKNIGIPTGLLIASLAFLIAIFVVYKIRKKNENKHSDPNIK